jgi:hypothetical protein
MLRCRRTGCGAVLGSPRVQRRRPSASVLQLFNFRSTARIRASRLPVELASFGSATRGCDLLSSAIAVLRATAAPILPIGIVSQPSTA